MLGHCHSPELYLGTGCSLWCLRDAQHVSFRISFSASEEAVLEEIEV